MTSMGLLATLAPATREASASDAADTVWRRSVESMLEGEADVRRLGADVFLADVGDGRNVRVELGAQEVRFYAHEYEERFYDEEHDRWEDDPDANSAIEDMVWQLARPMAVSLRWVLTERGVLEYGPRGSCPGCGAGVFEDELICPHCSTELDDDEDPSRDRATKSDVVAGFVRLLREERVVAGEPSAKAMNRLTRLFRNGIDNTPERFRSELERLDLDVSSLSTKRVAVLAEWARAGARLRLTEVLVLRPPTPGEASPFHDPTALRPLSLARLMARPDVAHRGRIRVVLHSRDAHSLVLTLKGTSLHAEAYDYSLRLSARLKAELIELADLVAEEMQAHTGWYVFDGTNPKRGFEPAGRCGSCAVECFAWQEQCGRCGYVLGTPDEARVKAFAILDSLLRDGHLELVQGAETKQAACTLAPVVATGDTAVIFDALLELDAVDEVFGDDDVLAGAIEAITRRD